MRGGANAILLLVLVIVLIAAVLGVLGAATARSDLAMARKQAETLLAAQDCVDQAQRWIAELESAGGHEGEILDRVFTDGGSHSLSVSLRLTEDGPEILRWQSDTQWTDSQALGSLFQK